MPANPPLLPLDIPPELAARGLVVAYSGGADSTALLHRLAALRPPRLRAVHVHHGLQADADRWVELCTRQCEALGLELAVCRVHIEPQGQGPEAAAREARYAALRQALREGEVLVTAHHQDDQAETVLLRLLRGSGVAGLAAMHALSEFPPGLLWRPLLQRTRAELRAYTQAQGLDFIEDARNRDPRYARSYLRAEIMPRLAARWPSTSRTLARTAERSREAALLLRERAAEDLILVRLADAALSIPALMQLSPERRRNLLRHWIESLALPLPFHDSLQRLESELIGARADASPLLAWPGAELRRYRDQLFALAPLPASPADLRMEWSGAGDCVLPSACGLLHGSATGAAQYAVRVPVPVTEFRPAGSAHTRSLKNLFQERGVPPWARVRTPALEHAGRVCWIGGIGWSVDAQAFAIEWTQRPPGG